MSGPASGAPPRRALPGDLASLAGPDNSARRSGAALVASALGVLPLKQVFTDWAWLPDVWIAILLTLGPATLLRTRWAARSVHLLPGMVLAACYLTAQFVPDHAWAGVLPTPGAWPDINAMITAFGDTVRDGSAPLPSTAPVRLMLAVLLALVAVVVDLLAVVARRPALAGVPFLLLFTIAGAIPRHSVGWLWFVLAALGYLLLLASDTRDELSRWGRLMPRHHGAPGAAVRALSARRIGVIAIVVALAIPLVLPVRNGNLLADALHGGSGGGGGGEVSLDPFVRLKGQLTRGKPVELLAVDADGLGDHRPLYLRELVEDQFDSSGWKPGDAGRTEPVGSTSFAADPASEVDDVPSVNYTVTIRSVALGDTAAPLFQSPVKVDGLDDGWQWSPRNGALVGDRMHKDDEYTETVAQPNPSMQQLRQSGSVADRPDMQRWLQRPASMPRAVVTQVHKLTAGISSPYLRTRAILDYFSPNNGFIYTLSTKAGDSGSDLVDFLQNKAGFCQQYAAAMGIMLRLAGVPSRVVVGYTHSAPNGNGVFSVSTNDAHAWVEAYFAGVGWLPFDPTPLSGTADAARSAQIPWAPQAGATAPDPVASASGNGAAGQEPVPSKNPGGPSDAAAAATGGGQHGIPLWVTVLMLTLVGLLVVIVALPGLVRLRRRRARLRGAGRGPDPLWQELADTAVDLGYVWSPVRTPRQVVTWLRREGVSGEADGALQTLARAVELSRYGAPSRDGRGRPLVGDLRRVEVSLRSRRTRWERARARLLPDSLGWLTGRGARRH